MSYRQVYDITTKELLWACEIDGGYLIQTAIELASVYNYHEHKYIVNKSCATL